MSGSMTAFSSGFSFRGSVGAAIRTRFLAAVALVAAEWRIRRDLAALQALDGRGLHDIGLTRGSLEGAVRHGGKGLGSLHPIGDLPECQALPSSWTEWR